MKRILSVLAVAVAAISMVACSPSYEKTIANLKASIDGESTAAAKYEAFAQKAIEEGDSSVAALFRAASKAEAIHVANHQAVLNKLGVTDYVATVAEFAVDSTSANIQTAINGETYETATMYPEFITAAQAEKCEDAILSFTQAKDAEATHAALYIAAASGQPFNVLYICPVCGDVYANQTVEACAICGASSDTFLVEIGAPVKEVIAATELTPATPAKK